MSDGNREVLVHLEFMAPLEDWVDNYALEVTHPPTGEDVKVTLAPQDLDCDGAETRDVVRVELAKAEERHEARAFTRVSNELKTASDREMEIVMADAHRAATLDAMNDELTSALKTLACIQQELTVMRKRDSMSA